MRRCKSLLSGSGTLAALVPLVAAGSVLLPASAAQAASRPRPVITSLSPSSGAVEGHNSVIIAGTGFDRWSKVLFGSKPALRVRFVSRTELIVISPPVIKIKIVRVRVITGGRISKWNRAAVQFGYSTVQIDELCPPLSTPTPTFVLWVSPRHRAWMYDKTTRRSTRAVLASLNLQDLNWRYGTETGLKRHKRYFLAVYLDGHRLRVPPIRMGRKCGFTVWRGRDPVRHRHHHRHHYRRHH